MPDIDEIVNKAIPLSFPGVKCAATIRVETEKARRRRVQLKERIVLLLNDSNTSKPGTIAGTEQGG